MPVQPESRTRGLSLTELLVTGAILGLLAAAAVPGLRTPAAQAEPAAALASDLASLRAAIDGYWPQHATFPGQRGAYQLANQLRGRTDVAGRPGTGLARGLPHNALTGTNRVRVVDSLPGSPEGPEAWIYDRTTGRIRANVRGHAPDGRRYFDL